MVPFDLLVAGCIAYVILLFAVAFVAERRARSGRGGWLRSPWVYTLSLSIYCTAWTFFGSVGIASQSGFQFFAIYLGPILVFTLGYRLIERMVQLSKAEKITSIMRRMVSV